MTPEGSPEITSATLSLSTAVCSSRNPHLLPHQDAVDSDDDYDHHTVEKQDKIKMGPIAPSAATTNGMRAPALNIPTDALGSVSAEEYASLPYLPLASPAASPRRHHRNSSGSGSGRSSGDTMSTGYLVGNGASQGTGSAAPLSHSDLDPDLPAVYTLVSDLHARTLAQHDLHTQAHVRLTRRLDALVLAVDAQLHQQRHHTASAGVYTYDPRLDAVLEEMQDARNQLLAILGRLEAHDAYRERHCHVEHDCERLAYDHDALVGLHESLKRDYADLHHAYDELRGWQRLVSAALLEWEREDG